MAGHGGGDSHGPNLNLILICVTFIFACVAAMSIFGRSSVGGGTAVVRQGYTGRLCARADGSTGREGYSQGRMGCWRF